MVFISPFREDRKIVRELLGENEFVEVFVAAEMSSGKNAKEMLKDFTEKQER